MCHEHCHPKIQHSRRVECNSHFLQLNYHLARHEEIQAISSSNRFCFSMPIIEGNTVQVVLGNVDVRGEGFSGAE